MRAIVALGNPGPQYATTRHNAGFLLADVLAEQLELPPFRRSGRALSTTGALAGEPYVLLKPQTYMNRSGQALASFLADPAFVPERDLLILVDDFAIPLGTFRLRAAGSAGGHNGLKSVEEALGSNEYARLRIGIGPVPGGTTDTADFVLEPFERAELATLVELLPDLVDAVECWLAEGIEQAMVRFNRKGSTSE